jgi:hypothetical protein
MIEVRVHGYRNALGRFARAWDWLVVERHYRMEHWGQRMVERAMDLSPKAMRASQVDPRRGPAGKFAEAWYYDIVPGAGTEEVLVLDNRSPIRDIVLFPTKPHRIPRGGREEQMAKGYPLLWYDLETGEPIRAWEVPRHPGTKGAYTHERVMEEMEFEMVADLQRLSARAAAMMEG